MYLYKLIYVYADIIVNLYLHVHNGLLKILGCKYDVFYLNAFQKTKDYV